jgi:hypothetical protein
MVTKTLDTDGDSRERERDLREREEEFGVLNFLFFFLC